MILQEKKENPRDRSDAGADDSEDVKETFVTEFKSVGTPAHDRETGVVKSLSFQQRCRVERSWACTCQCPTRRSIGSASCRSPVNFKRNFQPEGVSNAQSTKQSGNVLMKQVPDKREERKTARVSDLRTHDANSQGLGSQGPMKKQPGLGPQDP